MSLFNSLTPNGYYVYHLVQHLTTYVLPTDRSTALCMDTGTNTGYFTMQ